jgi:hypothetical protein
LKPPLDFKLFVETQVVPAMRVPGVAPRSGAPEVRVVAALLNFKGPIETPIAF